MKSNGCQPLRLAPKHTQRSPHITIWPAPPSLIVQRGTSALAGNSHLCALRLEPSITLADFGDNTQSHRYYAMAAATSASISQALAPYTATLQQLHTSTTVVIQQVLDPKVSIRTFCEKRWVVFSSSATGECAHVSYSVVSKLCDEVCRRHWCLGATEKRR